MSDIYGAADDQELPPPSVMRGAAVPSSNFIPAIRPAPQRQPARVMPEPPPLKLDYVKPYEMGKPDNSITEGLAGIAKQFEPKEDKDRLGELEKQLREALKPQAAATPPTVGSKAAPVLDPTQAPEGSMEVSPDGVPTGYFSNTRRGESGNVKGIINPHSGAAGLYQFAPSTVEGIRKANPALGITDDWRTSDADQDKLMRAYTKMSVDILRPQLKRDPTGGELYMTHLLGHEGGPRVLGRLDKPIMDITTPGERQWNPIIAGHYEGKNYVEHKTGQDLLNYFNKNF
jgi:hypothetical protein